MGSPAFRVVDLPDIRVTDARFAAGDSLPRHAHERGILAVILQGGFGLEFERRQFECHPGTVFVEPAGEPHANRIGRTGARVLVVELPRGEWAREEDVPGGLASPAAAGRPDVTGLALRLAREVDGAGAGSPLAVGALAWEMVGLAARVPRRWPAATGRQRWLDQVRDLLHATLDRPIQVGDLARQAGVHRVHLGRAFRQRYGATLGDYHRRLRIEWAARELARDPGPISGVALRAGFADQAHFTRFFRRIMGMTPLAWRRSQGITEPPRLDPDPGVH